MSQYLTKKYGEGEGLHRRFRTRNEDELASSLSSLSQSSAVYEDLT